MTRSWSSRTAAPRDYAPRKIAGTIRLNSCRRSKRFTSRKHEGQTDAEAKASLKQLLEKYDKANRTGCATLYLGRASVGAERMEYLTRAVEKFSDCYYFNGCQVGGWTLRPGNDPVEKRRERESTRVLGELKTKYKDATDHGGRPMGKVAEAVEKELTKP